MAAPPLGAFCSTPQALEHSPWSRGDRRGLDGGASVAAFTYRLHDLVEADTNGHADVHLVDLVA